MLETVRECALAHHIERIDLRTIREVQTALGEAIYTGIYMNGYHAAPETRHLNTSD